ncbi:phospholipase D family protein, partial [Dorea formicigenerans]|nr:phospholipase D family protein [Dorea formicigenerans]
EELTFETNKITLLSNPIESENKEPWMWYSLHRLMMSGKQATIYTPYIICGREMYDDLSQLTDNNVSVEIITNDVAKGA